MHEELIQRINNQMRVGYPKSDEHTAKTYALLKDCRAALQAEQGAERRWCHWTAHVDNEEVFDTECGNAWCFSEGNYEDNGCRFCPYCGGVITATPPHAAPPPEPAPKPVPEDYNWLSEHDQTVIADLRAIQKDRDGDFWPRGIAGACLRIIRSLKPEPALAEDVEKYTPLNAANLESLESDLQRQLERWSLDSEHFYLKTLLRSCLSVVSDLRPLLSRLQQQGCPEGCMHVSPEVYALIHEHVDLWRQANMFKIDPILERLRGISNRLSELLPAAPADKEVK